MRIGHDWPAGDYEAQSILRGSPRSAQTGNVGLEVVFSVDGNEVPVTMWLSEKAFERSRRQLDSLGFNGDFDSPQFSATGPFTLSLKHELYKEKMQPQWNLAGSDSKPDPVKLAAMSQRFKALAERAGGPPPVATPAKATTPPAAPAKAPPAPPAKKVSEPRDRNTAWAHFNTAYPRDAASMWDKAIIAISTLSKKSEEEFTEAEYGKVYDLAGSDIPF
jgi:hypothetical protein